MKGIKEKKYTANHIRQILLVDDSKFKANKVIIGQKHVVEEAQLRLKQATLRRMKNEET